MEIIKKRLDAGSYAKLAANLISDDSLPYLNEADLMDMGIIEKGPIKIILSVGAQLEQEENNINTSNQPEQPPSIQEILSRDPKFQKVMTRHLNHNLVPDKKGLRLMNRIPSNYFFEHQILREIRYPSWQEKHDLALKIIEAFPQLEQTRVGPGAPPESYFFWRCGGRNEGCHTGIIETRVGNMRKDVPPEERLFRRKSKTVLKLPEGIEEMAASLATLPPTPLNCQRISDGMMSCVDLLKWTQLQIVNNEYERILTTFPHLLSYNGIMIQQMFATLHPDFNCNGSISKLLDIGILMDSSSWITVEDKSVKGALRIIKKLTNRGVKRKDDVESTLEELIAAPLIRWIKPSTEKPEYQHVVEHLRTNGEDPLHLVCVADYMKAGIYYLMLQGHVLPVGDSAVLAIDVLLKSFAVFGVKVPVLLRKFHELVSILVWGTKTPCRTITVADVCALYREYDS